jgi:hypothetical protein
MNVGEFLPSGLSLLAFIEAQFAALKAKKEGKDWQKELFVKDSAVLGMMVGAEIAGLILPASLPILILIGLSALISYTGDKILESKSEDVYEKWLQ